MNKIVVTSHKRKLRTPEEKLALIEGYGLAVDKLSFCMDKGITPKHVHTWTYNLKKTGTVYNPKRSQAPKAPKELNELEALKLLLKLGYTIIPK